MTGNTAERVIDEPKAEVAAAAETTEGAEMTEDIGAERDHQRRDHLTTGEIIDPSPVAKLVAIRRKRHFPA